MMYAKVVNGEIVAREAKENPVSKLSSDGGPAWRPIEYETVGTPSPLTASAVAEVIEQTRVVVRTTHSAASLAVQQQAVKQEAQRRIIAITGASDIMSCLTKQLNAQMRAAELSNIKAEGGQLTAEQEAEAAALQALADSIKAIRAKSNEIEALDPIPADYAADARWT